MTVAEVKQQLAEVADPERARNLSWFFKTGKGQYGEGDRFIGITVPVLRRIAHRNRDLALEGIAELLDSPIHEHRTVALAILVEQYQSGSTAAKRSHLEFYLDHTDRVNNWDLVDGSAPYIVGDYLLTRSRRVLYKLVKSDRVWERRIAMVATQTFIRAGDLKDTFALAALLLGGKHDLIHKATGWMLREAGKKSPVELVEFLREHYSQMPRTALRYAIERFPAEERQRILRGQFD